MKRILTLHVSHETQQSGPIEGFSLLWAFYVRGFKPEFHCQKCFIGELAQNCQSRNHVAGVDVVLDQTDDYRFVYVCGVAKGLKEARRCTNLHFPLRYEAGSVAKVTTYNGYQFEAQNAVQMPIPDLAERWRGLPQDHGRCKNFRFGVEYFGANGVGLDAIGGL